MLIAVTDDRAFLELREFKDEAVLDSVTLSSRYMPPDFDLKEVVLGSNDEFLIRTRGGGTGIAETHLAVYGVVRRRIRRFGGFVVERQAVSWPDSDSRETLSGKVSFPKKNQLAYRYSELVARDGRAVTNSVAEMFSFNPRQMKYVQEEKP